MSINSDITAFYVQLYFKRKNEDGTDVLKIGRHKALEIFKRPSKAYCVMVFNKGEVVAREGYHGTSLPKKYHAVRWGCKKARELKIVK